ncbi:MAG: TIGR02300 family protein [Rickettsiales bacterium]|nr:TIGR02300 family protein [Rickettsiales bacterium]
MNQALGTKHVCADCSAKFYDMQASKVVCPKCGYEFPEEKKIQVKAPKTAAEKPKPVAQDEPLEELEGAPAVREIESLDDFDDTDVEHLEEVEDHHEDPEMDMNSDDAEDGMFIDGIAEDDLHIVDDIDEYEEERDAI